MADKPHCDICDRQAEVTTYEVIIDLADPSFVLRVDMCNLCQQTVPAAGLKKRWMEKFGDAPEQIPPETEQPARKYLADTQ